VGGYALTHAALAQLYLDELGCGAALPPAARSTLVEVLAAAVRRGTPRDVDLEAAPMLVLLA
jgi:hypothetical protein